MQSSLTGGSVSAKGENVVVPVGLCDGKQDAAGGGTSPYGRASTQQGDRLGVKTLRLASVTDADTSKDVFSMDNSLSPRKSGIGDLSIHYGRQQSRLTAQLAAKTLRRPSNVGKSLSFRFDNDGQREDGHREDVGPWGVLKKERQRNTWRGRAMQRLQRLNQSFIIRPGSVRFQYWFYLCVALALLTGWLIPFHFAFKDPGGQLRPYNDWLAIIEIISTVVFFIDFVLKFNIAYIDTDSGALVTSRSKMARHYVKSWQFLLDVLGWLPVDWVIIDTVAAAGANEKTLNGLAWLKLVHLARMYRIFDWFSDLDYRMVLSQGVLLLTRNYTYVFYVTHWAACLLYHIARHHGFSHRSWVGRNADRFVGKSLYEKYILALYFSVSAFTGLGDGALYASTVPEASFMILYLLFNLFLAAYILGTVTMLVVKGDERSKQFRERMSNLNEFGKNCDLPERLQSAMQEHLEVTFNTEQLDDEHVLGIYPTTIRRKVLRHLYLQPVKNCYLFKGCKQRFLDALLTAAHVELFMPAVQLMMEGDNVTELNIIVSGEVLVAEAGINLSAAFSQFATPTDPSKAGSRRWANSDDGGMQRTASMNRSASLSRNASLNRSASLSRTTSLNRTTSAGRSSMNGSIRDFLMDGAAGFMEITTGKKIETRYSSDALAQVPFFTDVPSNETIMSQSVVRVLSLPKAAWENLMQQFPQQARLVLANLMHRAELELAQELHEASDASELSEEELRTALLQLRDKRAAEKGDYELAGRLSDSLTQAQLDRLMKFDDVRAVVRATVRKVDQLRTFDFLRCAASGDIETLRNMLNQGTSPNSADYDGRTGLMLAASGGHEAVVRLLLDSGAKSDQLDAFGNSAMCEAVKNAHDEVIDIILSYGGSLAMESMTVASVMCTAVFEGDLVKLRRLLRSGAPPDACDYDKRSALHIAGAEGSLAAVKLLIEEGGADPNFQDRWGNTALGEARRVGAAPVVAYLESLMGGEQLADSGERYRQRVASDFLGACSTGDAARVRYIAQYSQPGCVFTGLVLAASKGHKDVVELLLSWVPSELLLSEGHLALVEASRMGHCRLVRGLRACGIQLPDPRDAALLEQVRAAVSSTDVRAVAAMLAAGIDVVTSGSASGLLHAAVATGSLEMVRRLVEDGGMRPNSEDSTGKMPAAVADAAKLVSIADYLRWAVSTGGGISRQALAAAAVGRFGALPDYCANDTHDKAAHGITAPDALAGTTDDCGGDDDVPRVVAQIAPPPGSNCVNSSQGPLSHTATMPRGLAMWKLSSMARLAGSDNIDSDGSVDLTNHSHPRINRTASLTGFLAGHRVDGRDDGASLSLGDEPFFDDFGPLHPPPPPTIRQPKATGAGNSSRFSSITGYTLSALAPRSVGASSGNRHVTAGSCGTGSLLGMYDEDLGHRDQSRADSPLRTASRLGSMTVRPPSQQQQRGLYRQVSQVLARGQSWRGLLGLVAQVTTAPPGSPPTTASSPSLPRGASGLLRGAVGPSPLGHMYTAGRDSSPSSQPVNIDSAAVVAAVAAAQASANADGDGGGGGHGHSHKQRLGADSLESYFRELPVAAPQRLASRMSLLRQASSVVSVAPDPPAGGTVAPSSGSRTFVNLDWSNRLEKELSALSPSDRKGSVLSPADN